MDANPEIRLEDNYPTNINMGPIIDADLMSEKDDESEYSIKAGAQNVFQ